MSRFVLAVGIALAGVSGAVALGHELLWTRRLVDLLGGSSEASTRVLSLFFLGLSLGAIVAQRILALGRNRMLWLGMAELCIGLSTLPVIYLSQLTDQLWPGFGAERLAGIEGTGVKFLISVFVILPPSIAMGTTLPLLFASVFRHGGALGRQGIWIYAINTAGGLVGLVGVVTLGLPLLGAFGAMCLLASTNVALGFLCLGLSRLDAFQGTPPEMKPLAETNQHAKRLWTIPTYLAFISGFGLLASEVVVLQTVMLVVPLSFHGPVAILGTVVALLAISAPIAARLPSKKNTVKHWLPLIFWAAGLAAVLSPFWYMTLVSSIQFGPSTSVFFFTMKIVLLVFSSFGVLFFLLGFVFPMSMILFEKEHGESVDDGAWCQLLVANGIGGLVGAEFAYRGLMPWFGVHVSLATIGLLYLATSALLARQWLPSSGWRVTSLGFGLLVTLIWGTRLPHMNPNLPFKILSESVGADGLVAVVDGEGPGRAIVVSNQYILGSSSGQYVQRRQAHLPLLLHPAPRSVGFIGLATGITPGGAIRHREVEEIVVAEISWSVVRAARDYLKDYNDGVFQDPRTRILVEDGRTLVAASPGRFDVLVGDLFLPWGAGASRLYSIEHFRSARASLREGGLFCQWLPMYQLTETQFERVLSTFQAAFPTTYLFRNSASPFNPSVGLVGFRDATLSWETVMQRCSQVSTDSDIEDPAMLHWETVAMHFLGTANPRQAEIQSITLDNLWLEIDASREQITGLSDEKYLSGPRWIGFLQNELPRIVSSDNKDPADPWRTRGLALMQWEWDLFETVSTRAAADESLMRSKKMLAESLPEPIRNAILKYPEAWSGSVELFQ